MRSGRHIDCYADGYSISPRRREKAAVLGEVIGRLFPGQHALEIVDFGCADGTVPVLLLNSPIGQAIRRITGITLLDYNDLPDKPCHAHPRFTRLVADLESSLDALSLPWGTCDVVLATAFFHYLKQPEIAFAHAFRLLRPGGYLIAALPARWLLRLRQRGIPGVLARNSRIRQIRSLNWWAETAAACGLEEISRQVIQWLGSAHTAALEGWLRRQRCCSHCGSNYLVVYRKPL